MRRPISKKHIYGVIILFGALIFLFFFNSYTQENNEVPTNLNENDWQTYSTDQFTLQYPGNYSIEEPKDTAPYSIVTGPKGRLEIGDYDWAAGPHIPELIEQQLDDQVIPQDIYYVNAKIGIALFYSTGDKMTQAELDKIADTITPR